MRNPSAAFVVFSLACACSGSEKSPSSAGQAGQGAGGAAGTPGAAAGSAGSAGSNVSQAGSMTQAGSGGTTPGGAGDAGQGGGAGSDTQGGQGPVAPDVAFCSAALDAAAQQYAGFRQTYTNPSSVPRSAKDGVVSSVNLGDWTSGFVGGNYWLLYEYTQDEAFRTAAEASTAAMDGQKTDGSSHDLGFQFMCTFGNGYRLTDNASYLNVLRTAAATLRTRFREPVGAIESWDHGTWDCPVIIDNMMNLRLLYFVTETGGDADFAELATTHAQTTLANHFRPDNSSFHVVNYNSTTGAVIAKQTHQGLADGSAWSRGQSWGLYGYTETYVATETPVFLEQARKIADYVLAHPNMPEDKVPYWDYDAPDTANAPTPRDSSAAAIMASALLQLAGLVDEPDKARYQNFALEILKSLASPAYAAAQGQNSHFLLMHSVGHLPNNSEIDVAINYADYYYLEALLRCRALAEN
jgi:unsaturated chondroitin disaccharide hydrolase